MLRRPRWLGPKTDAAADGVHWLYHNPDTPAGLCPIEQCTTNGVVRCALPAGHPYGHEPAGPAILRPHSHYNLMNFLHVDKT